MQHGWVVEQPCAVLWCGGCCWSCLHVVLDCAELQVILPHDASGPLQFHLSMQAQGTCPSTQPWVSGADACVCLASCMERVKVLQRGCCVGG